MTAPESDLDKMPVLRGILEHLDQGVAVFSPERKLLFMNSAMATVTGSSTKSIGGALSELAQKHRLRTDTGAPIDPRDFPIEKAFAGEETRDQPFIYIDSKENHVWLSVSCLRILSDDGTLRNVVTTIANITRRKSREDKLRFMIDSARILSLTSDLKKKLTEKAKLTVPSLADWCAIDLIADKSTERVAVVHQDPKMMQYISDFEKKYPTDPKRPGSVYNVIREQKGLFTPIITDEMLQAGALSPEHLEDIRKLQLKSHMIVPISARGRGLGAMTLAFAESGRVYTDEDFQFFNEFCSNLGVLLDNDRLYDEIRNRDAAKDLFLASLSHELRNPLAPIKSALELLKIREVPAEIREELDIIEHQFDHMARLLNDLLDVTRFTHSKISVTRHPADLCLLVERALKSMEALAQSADIDLHFNCPRTPIMVSVDETRLEQAITNLMNNAIKFTPAGGSIWVDVETGASCALIRVRDNGAGIHKDDLPNIFNLYYQGDHTRDQANSGLGIGLLLVQKIADLHDGSIEARSDGLGLGSEFIIRIPTIASDENQSKSLPLEKIGSVGKKVLIVDDNMQAADSLAKLLNKTGARADAVYSGEETLKKDLSTYDFILLDVGMPHMNGYELVTRLRSNGITIPIVALTGYGMSDDKDKAIAAGFTAHLTKPIGLKEIRLALGSLS